VTNARLYDLSIAHAEEGKIPELVFRPKFSAHGEVWELIKQELHICNYGQLSLLPEPLVYGPRECGRYDDGDDPRFTVRLKPGTSPHELAQVMQTTLWALNVAGRKEGKESNYLSLAEPLLLCDPSRDQHGYSISGWLHEAFLKWLGTCECLSEDAYDSLVADIIAIMRAVWVVMAPEEQRDYVSDCHFSIHEGRFSFHCFGNACDMSLYPDQVADGTDVGDHIFVSFGCHNVDWPWQQLTLLAGFAVLLETVRRSVDEQ